MNKKFLLIFTFLFLFAGAYGRMPLQAADAVKSGEILFYKQDKLLLNTGEIIDIEKGAPFRVNDKESDNFEVKQGQMAFVKINPVNFEAKSVDIYDNSIKEKTRLNGLYINSFAVKSAACKGAVCKDAVCKDAVCKDKKKFKLGDIVNITLAGTPHKKASYSVLGVVRGAAMKEVSRGVYKTSFRVFPGLDIQNSVLIGKLSDKQNEVSAALGGVTFAATKPVITEVSPPPSAVVHINSPYIFASYKSFGSIINSSKCAMYINGKEVRSEANMNLIIHKPENLPKGKNKVSITIADTAGNITYKNWIFWIK